MQSIVYVGMDVHKEKYTLCCYQIDDEKLRYEQTIESDVKYILRYLERVRILYKEDIKIICGYEAGCLGYTLYHQLTERGVECIILAPTTMAIIEKKYFKTDKRDAGNIAKCLAYHTYSRVHVPTADDEAVKEYIRMRDDQQKFFKATKQQILSLVLRQGYRYTDSSNWTVKHVAWLNSLDLGGVLQETLDEYLITYNNLADKIKRLDQRIVELSKEERYEEDVNKLRCLLGVESHTALATIVETGDFKRFATAQQFASYLGLVPGEHSSGETQIRLGITKAGNSHLRRLLIESANSFTRGTVGHKSKRLIAKQYGNTPAVIAYTDKANERLRRKYYRMTLKNGIKNNIAQTAIARELACFIWGLMTDKIDFKAAI